MNAHTELTQSLFRDMFTAPEIDYSHVPWDGAANVAAGKSTEFEPTGNARFDALVRALKPALRYGEDTGPSYDWLPDHINMPHRDSFASPADYLSTLAHELSHWTMRRVGRKPHMGDLILYAREEMTAEIACTIVLHECGADPSLDNRADYVRNWITGALDTMQERFDLVAKMAGMPTARIVGREDIDREFRDAVERAERAAGFILSAGSLAETN